MPDSTLQSSLQSDRPETRRCADREPHRSAVAGGHHACANTLPASHDSGVGQAPAITEAGRYDDQRRP